LKKKQSTQQKSEKTSPKKQQISIKTSPKTSKFQLKQAQKQATRKFSKKNSTPKKTSPNSREKRKVGNMIQLSLGEWSMSAYCITEVAGDIFSEPTPHQFQNV